MDQSVYTQKVLDEHVEFLGKPDKTGRHPMPQDAMDKLRKETDEGNVPD